MFLYQMWRRLLNGCTYRLSRILAFRCGLVNFCFNKFKIETHNKIVFWIGTGSCLAALRCIRKALCVAVTKTFFINVFTIKSLYSSAQFMLENKKNKITFYVHSGYKNIFYSIWLLFNLKCQTLLSNPVFYLVKSLYSI